MRWRSALLAFALSMMGTLAHADDLRVGKVRINPGALFDASATEHGGFYAAINRLHVQTRESLLRSFLLFHEGERYDEVLLRETERSLRALDFLTSASVTASPPHDGVVDVTVTTEDAFTTDVNGDFSNDGGRSIYDVDVAQKNVLGSGADIDVRVANLRERRTHSVEVTAPTLFRPYWSGDLLMARSSDGNEERFAIDHPLYSYTTRSTTSFRGDRLLQDSRIYENGAVAARFRQEHREVSIAQGTVLSASPAGSLQFVVGADLLSDTFEPLEGELPSNRHFRFLEMGLDSAGFRFVQFDHVDYGMKKQDYNLGRHASLYAAVSPGRLTHGTRTVFRLRSDESFGFALTPRTIVISTLSAKTRIYSANRNALWSGETRLIHSSLTSHPMTFVARMRLDYGVDLDREVQFFADGQNGLRAYPNYAFSGTRRFLFNAEQRMFLGRELLSLAEPGVAAFVDAGEAWGSSVGHVRADAGVGFRLSLSRFDSALIRFDCAYAFHDSPLSKRGVVFSIATSQVF